ncbi:hypothetical protein N9X12_06225 [Alphaproteobacteria bacterium]|jgi:small-conductance mechanosensitive channel|nr:hypothetical protein [Alphaproteobacteria bacterium]
MHIAEPLRKPIYAHLTVDAKEGLDALAKYHRTTLTNLLEEGAHMVIRSHLKQIQLRDVGHQQASSLNDSFSW